jgi:membrane protease YdiL (CAAX protease family)
MFDFTDSAFDRFVDQARPNASFTKLGLGILIMIVTAVALIFILSSIGASIWGLERVGEFFAELEKLDTPKAVLFALFLVPFQFIGLFFALWWVHKRTIRSVFGYGPLVRNFEIAVIICLLLYGAITLFQLFMDDGVPNMPVGTWFLYMIPLLPILLLQVTTEELIFRGYLLQQFAAISKNPIVWMVIPSAIFGSLHYDPNKMGQEAAILVVVLTGLFGLILADLTRRTGNIAAAVGVHFVNNFIAICILPLGGTMTGISLFISKISVDDPDQALAAIQQSFVSLGIATIIYFAIVYWLQRKAQQ